MLGLGFGSAPLSFYFTGLQAALQTALSCMVLVALSPSVLANVLTMIRDDPSAAERLGVPERRERIYLSVVGALTFAALLWAASLGVEGRLRGLFLEFSLPGEYAFVALMIMAVVCGSLLTFSLAQRSLERRLGAGFGSMMLSAAGVGTVLSLLVTSSTRLLPMAGFTLVGVVLVLLYRTVPSLPWAAMLVVGGPVLAFSALEIAGVTVQGLFQTASSLFG